MNSILGNLVAGGEDVSLRELFWLLKLKYFYLRKSR